MGNIKNDDVSASLKSVNQFWYIGITFMFFRGFANWSVFDHLITGNEGQYPLFTDRNNSFPDRLDADEREKRQHENSLNLSLFYKS